jgi:vacuolar-type H+-ATPase subunit D/Vma8
MSTRPAPTRADRQRLAARLELVEHAADLLRSKEEALDRERVRLQGYESRAADEWRARWAAATRELLRARALGAGPELDRLARTDSSSTAVTPRWQTSMGVTYPGSVDCELGTRPELTSTAALRPATDAYVEALDAAAGHAAAAMAVHRLERELNATRRRRRAIEEHLRPSLQSTIRRLDLQLDELDRESAMRVRVAVDRRKGDW